MKKAQTILILLAAAVSTWYFYLEPNRLKNEIVDQFQNSDSTGDRKAAVFIRPKLDRLSRSELKSVHNFVVNGIGEDIFYALNKVKQIFI